jgi:putative oxidoreductase
MPAGSAVAIATRSSTRWRTALSWGCRLIAAVILSQTLYFKFTAAPESVYIFTKLGVFLNHFVPAMPVQTIQVYARIGSGIMELIAAILILVPRTVWAGAVLAMAATGGAIFSHLTFLGLVVMDDGGLLFALALIVFATSAVSLCLHRWQIPVFGRWF